VTNTLAYCKIELVTTVGGFVVQALAEDISRQLSLILVVKLKKYAFNGLFLAPELSIEKHF